ncbi:TIGR02391 family protein [Frankia sp. CcI49]|uniref:TIGR02391 family protein n=1 Tax=Frankia sp. CcI49 TaxID=1745382 RepID=UPI0009767311
MTPSPQKIESPDTPGGFKVQVRERSGLPNSQIGTALIQAAFRPSKNGDPTTAGPLCRHDAEGGESVAMMELFKGAVGLFKNPSSHRRVTFDDPTEAAEIILLADLLLRLLRKIPPTETSIPGGAP